MEMGMEMTMLQIPFPARAVVLVDSGYVDLQKIFD